MKAKYPPIRINANRQGGAVLVVALILLVVLTMLGISAMESTKLETRMAANTEEYNRTFQMAEAGLAQMVSGYAQNAAALLEFPEDEFVSLEDMFTYNGIFDSDAIGENGSDGKCKFCLMRSSTQVDKGTSLSRRYFVVESTGFNTDDENSALQVKLVGGMTMDLRRDKNILDTNVTAEDLGEE